MVFEIHSALKCMFFFEKTWRDYDARLYFKRSPEGLGSSSEERETKTASLLLYCQHMSTKPSNISLNRGRGLKETGGGSSLLQRGVSFL